MGCVASYVPYFSRVHRTGTYLSTARRRASRARTASERCFDFFFFDFRAHTLRNYMYMQFCTVRPEVFFFFGRLAKTPSPAELDAPGHPYSSGGAGATRHHPDFESAPLQADVSIGFAVPSQHLDRPRLSVAHYLS